MEVTLLEITFSEAGFFFIFGGGNHVHFSTSASVNQILTEVVLLLLGFPIWTHAHRGHRSQIWQLLAAPRQILLLLAAAACSSPPAACSSPDPLCRAACLRHTCARKPEEEAWLEEASSTPAARRRPCSRLLGGGEDEGAATVWISLGLVHAFLGGRPGRWREGVDRGGTPWPHLLREGTPEEKAREVGGAAPRRSCDRRRRARSRGGATGGGDA